VQLPHHHQQAIQDKYKTANQIQQYPLQQTSNTAATTLAAPNFFASTFCVTERRHNQVIFGVRERRHNRELFEANRNRNHSHNHNIGDANVEPWKT